MHRHNPTAKANIGKEKDRFATKVFFEFGRFPKIEFYTIILCPTLCSRNVENILCYR
jgi:hypothetical protein